LGDHGVREAAGSSPVTPTIMNYQFQKINKFIS